jgi:hypothetical protein
LINKIVYARDGRHYYLDGKEVSKDVFNAAMPSQPIGAPDGHRPGCWPILSDALAVHPVDIEEAREDSRIKGVPTDFLPDGRAILESRQHRKQYLKAYGFHDRQGGYGD